MNNFSRLGLLAGLVLAAAGFAPATASAASCAPSEAAWVGTYEGLEPSTSQFPDAELRVRVSAGASGLTVQTWVNDMDRTQYGPATIPGGNLTWVTRTVALPFALYKTYETTTVTCGGGQVTAFSGVTSVRGEWIGPFAAPSDDPPSTFEVTRTG